MSTVIPYINLGYILHACVNPQCLLMCRLFIWIGLLHSLSGTKNPLKYHCFGAPVSLPFYRSPPNLACESLSMVSSCLPNFTGIGLYFTVPDTTMQNWVILSFSGCSCTHSPSRITANFGNAGAAQWSMFRCWILLVNFVQIGLFSCPWGRTPHPQFYRIFTFDML